MNIETRGREGEEWKEKIMRESDGWRGGHEMEKAWRKRKRVNGKMGIKGKDGGSEERRGGMVGD